ncbi:hypothetical protein TMatcc_010153 [Talaromyces marneffei ATCC 18224]
MSKREQCTLNIANKFVTSDSTSWPHNTPRFMNFLEDTERDSPKSKTWAAPCWSPKCNELDIPIHRNFALAEK